MTALEWDGSVSWRNSDLSVLCACDVLCCQASSLEKLTPLADFVARIANESKGYLLAPLVHLVRIHRGKSRFLPLSRRDVSIATQTCPR